MEDVEFGKIYDFYLPPSFLRLQESPSVNTMWRILDKGASNGGLAAGAMKPKLGMQPKPVRPPMRSGKVEHTPQPTCRQTRPPPKQVRAFRRS